MRNLIRAVEAAQEAISQAEGKSDVCLKLKDAWLLVSAALVLLDAKPAKEPKPL